MSNWKPIEIELSEVCGVNHSLRAIRLPKPQSREYTFEENLELASRLVKAGDDHAKAIRGIQVYLEIKLQVGFMIEFETYRHGVECLSTSSAMHGELKGLRGDELAEEKQKGLVDKVYTRSLTMSYQALRNIYKARRNHRHPDWDIFCHFIESLPHFDKLIYPEGS